jgi:hypothetical protein
MPRPIGTDVAAEEIVLKALRPNPPWAVTLSERFITLGCSEPPFLRDFRHLQDPPEYAIVR